MQIQKVIIHNFRAFKDATIELGKFNCIIGKNDSGKSTIFAALDWFFNDIELSDSDFNVDNIKEYRSIKHTEPNDKKLDLLSVEVHISDAPQLDYLGYEHTHNFLKDCCNEKKCLCIRKEMLHSDSNRLELNGFERIKFLIKVYSFDKLKKPLSFYSKDKLEQLYVKYKIGDLNILKRKVEEQYDVFISGIEGISLNDSLLHEIRESIYSHFVANSEAISEEWMEVDNGIMKDNISKLSLFRINGPRTSLNDYFQLLINNEISKDIEFQDNLDRIKVKISDKISDIDGESNRILNSFDFEVKKINLVTHNNIPIDNRGEGIKLKYKNLIFKLMSKEDTSISKSIVFAFEEPETHLHPRAQLEMYETIKVLSENSNYQVFITTHSPYIVKHLAEDKIKPIVVKRETTSSESITGNSLVDQFIPISQSENNYSTINELDERVLPYVSMNEMNFIAFEEPSIEYHIELFGFMQNKLNKKVKPLDNWIKTDCSSILTSGDLFDWYNTETLTIEPNKMTLPYCVRNNIDHPLVDDVSDANKHNAYENNKIFNDDLLIKRSIEIMRKAILAHRSEFV